MSVGLLQHDHSTAAEQAGTSLIRQTPKEELFAIITGLRDRNLTGKQMEEISVNIKEFTRLLFIYSHQYFGLSLQQINGLENKLFVELANVILERTARRRALVRIFMLSNPIGWMGIMFGIMDGGVWSNCRSVEYAKQYTFLKNTFGEIPADRIKEHLRKSGL